MLLRLDSNIPPVATIASATPQIANVPVQFVASGTDADGTVVLYEWDWEDDGIFDYSSPSTGDATHVYATAGKRDGEAARHRRRRRDRAGRGSAVRRRRTSRRPRPSSARRRSRMACRCSSSPTGATPTAPSASYEWDWEDDGTFDYSHGGSGNASHTLCARQPYREFRVTDNDGAIDDDTVVSSSYARGVHVVARERCQSAGNGRQSGTHPAGCVLDRPGEQYRRDADRGGHL